MTTSPASRDDVSIRYDVAIVGGGHNGLAAACYLALARKKVIVIEALDQVGGLSSSGCFIPKAPQHHIHVGALDLLSLRVHPMMPIELDLERHGFMQVELSPAYVYLHPDGNSLVFWRDPQQTAAEIRRFSAPDADAFLALMGVLDAFMDMALPMMRIDPTQSNYGARFEALRAVLRNRKLKPEVMALMNGSAHQAIVDRFTHPVTISAMCCLLGAAGPLTDAGTGLHFSLLGFVHRFGVGRVVGGMQQLSNALAARLTELGGVILLGSQANEIVIAQGRTLGVMLMNLRMVEADAVIASMHAKTALKMATPRSFDAEWMTRAALVAANPHGAAPLKVDMALNGQVSVERHETMRADGLSLRKCVLLIGTSEAVLENYAASARGEVPKLPYMWISAPSAVDPSQAPPGQDVVYLYPLAMPVNPRGGWGAIRKRVGQQVIDQADDYMHGLKAFEIGRRVEAAPDLEARLSVHLGCAVAIDTTTLRSGQPRPAQGLGAEILPVAGFYLGGAGIRPGDGVNGLSGRIAANRVMRFLARKGRRK